VTPLRLDSPELVADLRSIHLRLNRDMLSDNMDQLTHPFFKELMSSKSWADHSSGPGLGRELDLDYFYSMERKPPPFLGRPYEDSTLQWLAAEYAVAKEGTVTIQTPYAFASSSSSSSSSSSLQPQSSHGVLVWCSIPNLDRTEFPLVWPSLSLFQPLIACSTSNCVMLCG
jgi:hypothetical protein